VALLRRCFGSFFALQKRFASIAAKKRLGFLVGPERFFSRFSRDFILRDFRFTFRHFYKNFPTTGAHRGSSSSSSNNDDTTTTSSCGSARVNEQLEELCPEKNISKKVFRESARARIFVDKD